MDPFEFVAKSLKPHPSKAQILLEVKEEGETLDKALRLLKDSGNQSVRSQVVSKKHPEYVLLSLGCGDMRDAVLLLSEAGFNKLKGINSLQQDRNDVRWNKEG